MALTQNIKCSKLAKLLDVTPRTIRNWAADPINPLPAKKVNGVWLFECEAVEKWLEQKDKANATVAIVNEVLSKF